MADSVEPRYDLDQLRRVATGLATNLGVAPARASALATHLLWFDAAGASSQGIATLPAWLDRIARREVDPKAEGRVVLERAGTAVFDAGNGLAPLALERAAGIASEKAREVGVGIVRVRNLGPTGPPTPVVANLAVGPFQAVMTGPDGAFALAFPTREGLPIVLDSRLAPGPRAGLPDGLGWVDALTEPNGWLIVALSVPAMEPLDRFHDRMAATFPEPSGLLAPANREAARREARDRGVTLSAPTLGALGAWADRLGLAPLKPIGG